MTITLSAEVEAIVREGATLSGFRSVDAYVEACLLNRQASDPLLDLSPAEVSAAIDVGWEQAKRGELLDSEAAWANLEEHKKRWRAEHAR